MGPDPLLKLLARFQDPFESLDAHGRVQPVESMEVRTPGIEGLPKTNTDYRAKDRIDREALERLRKLL